MERRGCLARDDIGAGSLPEDVEQRESGDESDEGEDSPSDPNLPLPARKFEVGLDADPVGNHEVDLPVVGRRRAQRIWTRVSGLELLSDAGIMAEGCDLLCVGAVDCLLSFASAAEREHGLLEHVFVFGCVGGIDG